MERIMANGRPPARLRSPKSLFWQVHKVSWCLMSALLVAATAQAEDGDLWSRTTLTGDWGGARSQLQDSGVSLGLESTTFYQGGLEGDGRKHFDASTRVDGFFNLDLQKLGLWQGGGLNGHIEYRGDNMQNFRGGAILPVNSGTMLPLNSGNEVEATSLYLSQMLGERTSMLLGKINAVDLLAADPFFGGWGTQRFWNMAFVAPPNGIVPAVLMGGLISHFAGPYTLNALVFDPTDQTDQYALNHLFGSGTAMQLSASWVGALDGRATSATLAATYSTKGGADLGELDLPPDARSGDKSSSHSVSLQVNHLLLQSSQVDGKGLGVYALGAINDGNPNAIKSSFAGGLAGHGMVPGRPNDSFGLGYFYYNFSDDLQSTLQPILDLGSEQGVELYYNLAVTPWLTLGGDFQWLEPALERKDRALVGGLRLRMVY